jgi:transcriptional regulator with XRE-family HTH domain
MRKQMDNKVPRDAIGERVRQLRQTGNMTLATVAKRSGISAATLSKIENDKVSPTFANLIRLAEAFDTSLAQLIGTTTTAPPTTARVAVTRREDVTFTSTHSYDMGALCTDLRNKRMSPFLDRVYPSNPKIGDRLVQHVGEEFVYVLKGVIEIHTEHYQPIRLRVGDSAYFDSQMAHAYRSEGDEPAEMLMIYLGPEGSSDSLSMDIVKQISELGAEREPRDRQRETTPEREFASSAADKLRRRRKPAKA